MNMNILLPKHILVVRANAGWFSAGRFLGMALSAGLASVPVSRAAETIEPKSKEECLMATARIRKTDPSGMVSFGSGFFLNEGDSTYLYTSARTIDGADKLEISDYRGVPVTGIDWIEEAEPSDRTAGPDAGDGVRIKLTTRRETALALTTEWNGLTAGRELLVLGITGGAGMRKTGIMSAALKESTGGILHYNCNATAAAGGGAVVDAQSLKVVAINIWVNKALPDDPYKRMLGISGSEGAVAGVVFRNAQWKRFAIKDYLAQGRSIRQLRNNLEMMILVTYLMPGAGGLPAVPGDDFVAGMKVGDAILKHDKDPLILRLQSLNDRYGANAATKIRSSSQSIYKEYITTLDMILKKRAEVSSGVRPDKFSYYHRVYLERSLLTAGDLSYAAGITAYQAWFKQKSSVGGGNPLGRAWESFPSSGAKLAKTVEQILAVKIMDEQKQADEIMDEPNLIVE